jgi:hypothetical protein
MTTPEDRAAALGLVLPDYADPPYGGRYGTVKAFHRTGRLVQLSGITGEDREGRVLHQGALGAELDVEQGREAGRLAAANCLGMMRLAVGSLDNVAGICRVLGFVASTPEFTDHHEIGQAVSDVFLDVLGRDAGLAGRGFVGASSLSRRNCVELWVSFEARPTGLRRLWPIR